MKIITDSHNISYSYSYLDIDECLIVNKCGTNGVCVNTLGSFKCSCKQGYQNLMGNCIGTNFIHLFLLRAGESLDE